MRFSFSLALYPSLALLLCSRIWAILRSSSGFPVVCSISVRVSRGGIGREGGGGGRRRVYDSRPEI